MKKLESAADLAIFGAEPLFEKARVVGYPRTGDKKNFYKLLDDMFERNYLTNNGPCVRELEKKLSEYLCVKNVIAVCNATIGLEVAAFALGLSGEVIVPSFTFIATAHILQWLGIKPVFVDVAPDTHCIDPKRVEKKITDKTTGILGVHLWGSPCDMDALHRIAEKNKLKLLFDSAHAFGCSYKDKMIGAFGDCEVFSFHATKIFNTFEGGAITTNNDELAHKIRKTINFGFNGYDNVQYLGINGKMSEPAAAMGLANLEEMPRYVSECRSNYMLYNNLFSDIDGMKMYKFDESSKNNYHYIVFEVDERPDGLTRDMLCEIIHAENCLARRYFTPGCHNSEPYKTLDPDGGADLPVTERLCERTILFPNSGMSAEDIKALRKIIGLAMENASIISGRGKEK